MLFRESLVLTSYEYVVLDVKFVSVYELDVCHADDVPPVLFDVSSN